MPSMTTSLWWHSLGEVRSRRRLILMENQDNACKRDGVIGIQNGLGNTTLIHEYSTGGIRIQQDKVSIDGAQLGVVARDSWIIDHQIIIQHAPDMYDRLVQGIASSALHEKNSVWRNAIKFFIHTLIIISTCCFAILCNHPVTLEIS